MNAKSVAVNLVSLKTSGNQNEDNETNERRKINVRWNVSGAMIKEQQAHKNGGDPGSAAMPRWRYNIT